MYFMKELLKKRYKKLIELVDSSYEKEVIKQHGQNFKYVFEVPSNFCIYPNYKCCHEEGYLTDGYGTDEEYEFIDFLLRSLGYSELKECEYGWEFKEAPLFSKEEIVELLNHSTFIDATIECPFATEDEEIKRGKERQEICSYLFSYSEQSMLESVEDDIVLLSMEGAI